MTGAGRIDPFNSWAVEQNWPPQTVPFSDVREIELR